MPYQASVFPQDYAAVGQWLSDVWQAGEQVGTVSLLSRLNQKIADTIAYTIRTEPGVQSPQVTLDAAQGSCRDVATLFIEACRYFGLASRFVSGYLVSNAAVQDHATTHA